MARHNLGKDGFRRASAWPLWCALSTLACGTESEPSDRPAQAMPDGGDGDQGSTREDAGADDDHTMEPGRDAGDEGPVPGIDAPSVPVTFAPSDADLLNPERGFYTTTLLTSPGDLSYVREEGKSLVYAAVHLQDYLPVNHEQDLPAKLLDDVRAGFKAVRDAGIKAVVRFQYDDGEGYPGGANDASEATMERHIAQLEPVLRENEDVLFVLQAGFIGAWGEWHTSLNFVDGPDGKDARARVVDALLAAAPSSRRVALRYPAYKRMFFGEAPSTLEQLASGEASARVAHLNDCFLSSDDDVGTYQYEPLDTLKAYLAEDTRVVPIGGETCAVHERNSCSNTLAEMERFHWTYINDQYHPDVLARWLSEGCRPEIEQRLGYRLALSAGSLPESVRPGGSFVVDLTVLNQGWAALTNARPVFVVLEGNGQRLVAQLDTDVRTWLPGEHRVQARLRVPSALAEGDYRLALWLPDAAQSLRERAEYAIRLANDGLWADASGDNTLATLTISASTSGSAVSDAGEFALVP